MTLYSTGCPKCNVLKMKLDAKQIPYEISEDLDFLMDRNIMEVPVLELENGNLLSFTEAVSYINTL